MCSWQEQEDAMEVESELYAGIEAQRELIISPDSGERVKELAWEKVDNLLDILSDLRVIEKVVQIIPN